MKTNKKNNSFIFEQDTADTDIVYVTNSSEIKDAKKNGCKIEKTSDGKKFYRKSLCTNTDIRQKPVEPKPVEPKPVGPKPDAGKKATDEDWSAFPCVTQSAEKLDNDSLGVVYRDDNYAYFANGRCTDGTSLYNYKCDGDNIVIEGVNDQPVPNDIGKKTPYVWADSPFKDKKEGDKFRMWVNYNYPDFADKIQLDPKGRYNNSYIEKAWKSTIEGSTKTYGQVYQENVGIDSPKPTPGTTVVDDESMKKQLFGKWPCIMDYPMKKYVREDGTSFYYIHYQVENMSAKYYQNGIVSQRFGNEEPTMLSFECENTQTT